MLHKQAGSKFWLGLKCIAKDLDGGKIFEADPGIPQLLRPALEEMEIAGLLARLPRNPDTGAERFKIMGKAARKRKPEQGKCTHDDVRRQAHGG